MTEPDRELTRDADEILRDVGKYYGEKFRSFGATPQGVDWNSRPSQELRFDQLGRLFTKRDKFSLIDFGCGYGALAAYLHRRKISCRYVGFDICPQMITKALEITDESDRFCFVNDRRYLAPAHYLVASGVFNVRLRHSDASWKAYVSNLLNEFHHLSTEGFAFNMLTSYSDAAKIRDDLFYADPSFYFDLCKRTYSRNVALLHDYDLYEFTLLVRKAP